MEPVNLWFILVCFWGLTHLWLLPLSKDRWKTADLRQKIARAGTLVVLEKVRELSAIGVLTVGLLILLVWIAGALSIVSFAAPKVLIEGIASVYHAAKAWAELYAVALGIAGLIGAAVTLFLCARHARQRITETWLAKANEVRTRLLQNPTEIGEAQEQPELKPIAQRLEQLIGLLAQHDQNESGSSLTTEDLEALQAEISSVMSMLAIEIARKELKFDMAIATPTDEEKCAPTTLSQRWIRVLISDSFVKDLGLMKKPLSYLITALLLVSLIGWTAEPLANSLQLAVNNLRVNVLAHDATRELNTVLSQTPPPAPEAPDFKTPNAVTVQTASRLLAHAVARDMVRSGIMDHLAQSRRTALSEAEFVRASIVERHIDLPEYADTTARVRKEVADAIARNQQDTAAMTRLMEHIERELHPHVDRLHQEKPRLFAQMATKLEARYAAPLSPLDAQGRIIARVLDEALGGIDVRPTNELGKQGQKLLKEFGKEAVKTWANAFAKNYVADLIIETTRPGVVARASGGFGFEVSTETSQFAKNLHAAEGRGWVGSVAEQQDVRLSQAVANRVATYHNREYRGHVTDRLGGYDHLFPQVPDDRVAGGAGGDAIPGGGGTGGSGVGSGGGGGGGRQPAPQSQGPGKGYMQSRATNFRLAARSFRVRGVLIGQDLPSKGLDATDMRWIIQPAGAGEPTRAAMEIRLGAQWKSLGSFAAAVVNQSLRYAADRRVIATTITPGDGKIIRRVTYLHPVLADTPLGCRIIEADRFVDTFSFPSSREPVAPRLAQIASDREQISRWMEAVELAERVSKIPSSQGCPLKEIERVIKDRKLGAVRLSPAVAASFERFLTTEEKKFAGSTNFLRNAHACATVKTEALALCLCNKVRAVNLPDAYWFPEDHTSQFRERQETLSLDLDWMKRSRDHLAHIDLWVHTTFALRKNAFGDRVSIADESTATAVDFPEEQLASLKEVISAKLPRYLEETLKSPSYDDFMMPLEDFVLLQRFMRAAFAGALGRDFPITKLVQLERDTRKFVPHQPTIRWEPVPNSESMLIKTLREADPKAAESFIACEKDRYARYASKKPLCDSVSK
jgi:hypothetical protein